MKKIFNNLLPFLLLIFSLLLGNSSIAETLPKDWGNRFEGYKDYDISTKFQPLALHLGKIQRYKNDSVLSVRFFVPEQEQNVQNVQIEAGRINQGKRRYYMKVKKTQWPKGWQTFKPWPVSDVLLSENISSKELALRIVADNFLWLPAQCLIDHQDISPTDVFFYFYTPRWISELTYKIGRHNGSLKNQFGPSPFKITFPARSLNPGKNKLSLSIKWKGSGTSVKNYDIYYSQPLEQ